MPIKPTATTAASLARLVAATCIAAGAPAALAATISMIPPNSSNVAPVAGKATVQFTVTGTAASNERGG